MQLTFRRLTRSLLAGATVPVLSLALAAPEIRAQATSSDASTSDAATTDETATDDTSKEQSSDTQNQADDQSTTQQSEQSTDRKANASRNRSGQQSRSTRSATDGDRATRSRDRSDDEDATGPSFGTTRETRQSARDSVRQSRQGAREDLRDTRDTIRDTRSQARDTARDAREYARDTARDDRDDWQDTRRDSRDWARDTTRDQRDDGDWRSELRDFARDTARDAIDYGRSMARDAMDSTRDTNRQDGNQREFAGDRQWDDFSRDAARRSQDFDRDMARDSRDFARDDRDSRDSRGEFRGDREDLRRQSFGDTGDQFARDSFRRDERDLRDTRGQRDEFRSDGDQFRSDRDSFVDSRSRDSRTTRITRSQIDNFRAASVSPRDLGLSLERTSRGLIVDDVGASPIARTIGLRPRDQIVAIEDYRVTSEDQFVRYLFDQDWRYDRVAVWVVRDGREVPIYVRPVQLIERLIVVQDDYNPLATFGVVLDNRYDDELVVRRVLPNTAAFRAGLRPGDVIVRFYGQRLATPRQFVQVLNRVNVERAPIVVERDRRLREFQVSLPDELRTTSQRRTTYRRETDGRQFDDRFDTRIDNRNATQWQSQPGSTIEYGGTIYQDSYRPSGVITTQPAQPVYRGQIQPAQPVQPSTRVDDDRVERPGILPRLFGR